MRKQIFTLEEAFSDDDKSTIRWHFIYYCLLLAIGHFPLILNLNKLKDVISDKPILLVLLVLGTIGFIIGTGRYILDMRSNTKEGRAITIIDVESFIDYAPNENDGTFTNKNMRTKHKLVLENNKKISVKLKEFTYYKEGDSLIYWRAKRSKINLGHEIRTIPTSAQL